MKNAWPSVWPITEVTKPHCEHRYSSPPGQEELGTYKGKRWHTAESGGVGVLSGVTHSQAVRNSPAGFWSVILGAMQGRDTVEGSWQKYSRQLDILECKFVRKWI